LGKVAPNYLQPLGKVAPNYLQPLGKVAPNYLQPLGKVAPKYNLWERLRQNTTFGKGCAKYYFKKMKK
jgi:hypothetical protein